MRISLAVGSRRTRSIVGAVNSCIPVTNVMSVDEMACRLMGRERALPNATTIAVDIKQALRTVWDTLRCSVGLAPNRYLSKIASDLCKPDGLTVFLPLDLPQAPYCLELSDLVGIGQARPSSATLLWVGTPFLSQPR